MKKLLCAVFAAAIMLTGCGSDTQKEMTEAANAVENQSVQDIYSTVSALSSQNLVVVDDTLIQNYYGISIEDLDEYVFAQSDDPSSAEIVVIAKAKEGADLSVYKENFENLISQKTDEMTNYNKPDQVELLNNAVVDVQENAICVVVSDKADTMSDTIEKGLGM